VSGQTRAGKITVFLSWAGAANTSEMKARAAAHFTKRTESYFVMTPQAMRSPEFPDGSLIKSSAFA
jgi:hypothetical protein